MLLAAIPLVAASILILFGGEVERSVLRAASANPYWNPPPWVWLWFSRAFRYSVAFATTVLVTALLYYFGPYRRQQWRNMWPGAILATLL